VGEPALGSPLVFIGIEDLVTAGRRSKPRCPALRLLPLFLSAECGQIEEIVSPADRLPAATVGGISVENLVAVAQKAAQARQIEGLFTFEVVGCPRLFVLSLGPIVVLQRSNRWVSSFSLASSSKRAGSHSARVTTLGFSTLIIVIVSLFLNWVAGQFSLLRFLQDAVRLPVEVATATMTAIAEMHTGHIVFSFSFIDTTNESALSGQGTL
jgi:hypothetical protein